MDYTSPLGSNYGWIVAQDTAYVSRDLHSNVHAQLALAAAALDPTLSKIQKTLGYSVILRVLVGKYTISLRIYSRHEVEKRPDNLASRMGSPDPGTYLMFNPDGGLEFVDERLRERAQGHRPKFYADRRLDANSLQQLNDIERQILNPSLDTLGLVTTG